MLKKQLNAYFTQKETKANVMKEICPLSHKFFRPQ